MSFTQNKIENENDRRLIYSFENKRFFLFEIKNTKIKLCFLSLSLAHSLFHIYFIHYKFS